MSFADDGGARAANSDKLKEVMFGARVRYPITITRLLKKPGDKIRRQETLLQYSFRWQREAGDPLRDETWLEEVTTVADWDSPAEGVLVEWRVDEGDTVREDMPAMVVAEACPHSIQYGGLCALCGADMTEKNWAQDDLDTARAPINMVHDQTNLKVSASRAARAEEDLQRRLLRQRKLSLVVDLDQTIIHACIEPTIGEWQRDPTNPNYEAVKDVKSFQLNDDGTVGHHHMGTGAISGCWYYIKLRPGLLGFLERIATMYEMHVYTMGTRAYALNIARIVDPQKRLFGNRVLSRDENGSMTAKSLQRLFPVSTSMVAIIDDRSDVWPRNRGHLIKVTPYDFFKGIGDINSSFLPPREEVMPVQPIPVPPLDRRQMGVLSDEDAVAKDKAAVAGPSPLSADEEAVLRLQEEEQERVLERQLKERPLLHMQEELDKEDEAMGDAEPAEPPSVSPSEQLATESSIEHGQQKQQDSKAPIMSPSSPAQQQQPGQPLTHHHPHHRHNLLRDDDDELKYVEEHLSDLHDAFYVEYDRRVEALRKEDEAAALRSAEQSAATRTQLKRPGVARHQRQRSKSAEADDMSQQQPSGQKQPSPSEGNGYVDFRAVPDVVAILSRLRQNVLQGAVIVLSGMIPRRVDVRRSELGLQILSFGAELHARIGPRVTHLVVSTAMPGFKTEKVDEAAERGDILIVGEGWLHECMRRWAWVDEKPYIVSWTWPNESGVRCRAMT